MGSDITRSAAVAGSVRNRVNSTERFCRLEASVGVSGLQRARQFRQKNDRHRNANHAERQLVEAVGLRKRRHRLVLSGRDRRADQRVDLGDAAGDCRRRCKPKQPLDVRRQPRPPEAYRHAGMAHGDPDDGELHDAGSQHTPGEPVADCAVVGAGIPGIKQHPDQDDVEEYRRDRGGKIASQRIQHAGHHCPKRHADQVGEHDGGKRYGEVELRRVVGVARRHHRRHDKRHREFHQDGEHGQHRKQDAEHFFREAPRTVGTVGLDLLGEQRHEGGVEGAFREQPAERVGKLEGGIKGARHRAGAECRRH